MEVERKNVEDAREVVKGCKGDIANWQKKV